MTAGSSSTAADKALVSRIIAWEIGSQKAGQKTCFGKSAPEFGINLFKSFLYALFNLPSLFFLAQMFELPHVLHPGLFARCGSEFLLESFGDKPAQGDTPFGGKRFRPPEQEIGDFERGLHCPILPYLWDSRFLSLERT